MIRQFLWDFKVIKMIYKPSSKEQLKLLVDCPLIHLGDIDTSLITDMSNLFLFSKRTDFSGIENWDVSKVENMCCMFLCAENFNGDISKWNVSNVRNMAWMFEGAKLFNQPLNDWNVSSVLYIWLECLKELKTSISR